jgi:hypothetical protein
MKYKKIITCGCSFSDPVTPYTWVNLLERNLKRIYPELMFNHRGLSSQGNQLIQKKTVHAIHKALSEGYKPEEICVFVMWSGHERRSWFINNEDTIDRIVEHWAKQDKLVYQLQFGNLENSGDDIVRVGQPGTNLHIPYNKKGGWYITGGWHNEIPFFKEYLMFSEGLEESIMLSLENMVMLQSLCKTHNIKLYEQFYMDTVFQNIELYKDYKECRYLYDLLDKSNYVNTRSMHGYLKSIEVEEAQYFKTKIDPHPNAHGHMIWLNNILLPHLEKTGFLK